MYSTLRFVCLTVLVWQVSPGSASQVLGPSQSRPNVLFIAVDDLRADLGCYGNEIIQSPNLDRLASQGVLFQNHFVTVPTCGASRYSLLTGTLPQSRRELSNSVFKTKRESEQASNVPESFVEQLRRNGYYTVGIGKISHSADGYIYDYTAPRGTELELPDSWDEMLLDAGQWGTGWNAFFAYADGSNRNDLRNKVKPFERGEVDDKGYPDGLTAELAVKKLKELAGREEPFFLGVGFFKPHLPFNAPAKYWDMYDESTILLTPSPDIPENVHRSSLHGSNEFNRYQLGTEKASLDKPLSETYARTVKHAYYACISYIDAQIGKVLTELERLGIDDNTIVVVWGDHGWHLGDSRVWGKHTIFEWALRSAFIVKAPGSIQGRVSREIVSSIDFYPTLMELCGVAVPQDIDGKSFAPLLNTTPPKNWDNAAYSYYRNGISVRTDRYRLTVYFRDQQPVVELYDHRKDPYENKNVAADHPEIVKQLIPLWEAGDTGLYDDWAVDRRDIWQDVRYHGSSAGERGSFKGQVRAQLRELILNQAEWALNQEPVTVTANVSQRSTGGKHDFYSEGDYWWPDPENPDGPYIRRDGMTNPDNFVAHRHAMIRFSKIIGALASAYKLTGDEHYVKYALRHLKAWFTDPETLMNPHLLYAQAIQGRVTGRGIGIIDTIHLMEVAQGILVMQAASIFDKKSLINIKSWFEEYLEWLTTHPYGKDEMEATNNHGTCWVMQAASFAKLTANQEVMEFCRNRFKEVLLPEQMAADGSFPLELGRTKPYGYSLFNLDAMAMICQILSVPGDDLWKYETGNGRSIEKGISFLYPYLVDKSAWPYAPDVMYWEDWPVAQPFLVFGAVAYDNQHWLDTWKKLNHAPKEHEVIRNLPVRYPLIWLGE